MTSNSNFAPVTVSITPQRGASDAAREDEQKVGPTAPSITQMSAMIASMQGAMGQMMRQMEAMSQASSRRSVSEALSATHGEKAGEYSASASIQRPPVLSVQQRRTSERRQSMGHPSSAFTPGTMATPASRQHSETAAVRMDSLDEAPEEDDDHDAPAETAATGAAVDAEHDGLPVFDQRMHHVKKTMLSIMKPFPFHGQADVDTLNVLSWVEKIDTEFSINMGTRQAGRLDIVRSLLAGPALLWMNGKVRELNKRAERGELSEQIEWETMRKPFIDQHLGVNTVETFKAQLRALKLGDAATPTPVELNQEFDRLAALAYPNHQSDMRATVLGDEYGTIIAGSNITIYRSVAYNQNPSTLDEWKLHVSRRWAAGRNVEAVEARLRGSGRTRGGTGRYYDRNQAGERPTAASVNAMDAQDTRQEGEEPSGGQQLAAAGGGKSGQGGGGGGGYGPRRQLSAEEQKLWDEKRCFHCKETGHRKYECPKLAASRQQSKGKAGQ